MTTTPHLSETAPAPRRGRPPNPNSKDRRPSTLLGSTTHDTAWVITAQFLPPLRRCLERVLASHDGYRRTPADGAYLLAEQTHARACLTVNALGRQISDALALRRPHFALCYADAILTTFGLHLATLGLHVLPHTRRYAAEMVNAYGDAADSPIIHSPRGLADEIFSVAGDILADPGTLHHCSRLAFTIIGGQPSAWLQPYPER